jgi:hypothetical protein
VLENFLKTTIPGIVILGCIGSIVAALIMWIASLSVKKVFPKITSFGKRVFAKILVVLIHGTIRKQIEFYISDDISKITAYFMSLLGRMIVAMLLGVSISAWVVINISSHRIEMFSASNILLISASFMLFLYAIKQYICILVPVIFDLKKATVDVIKNFDKDELKAIDPEKRWALKGIESFLPKE